MNTTTVQSTGPESAYIPCGESALLAHDDVAALPSPLASAASPNDVLGLFMAMMEEMARTGIEGSRNKIDANRERLAEAMKEFKKQLEEIARKLEEAKEDDGGWFGDIVDAVCGAVGDFFSAIGAGIEFVVDTVRAPIDIAVGLLKGENIGALLEQEVKDLTTQGKLSKTIGEAAKGLAKLVLELEKAVVDFAAALAKGENPIDAIAQLGKDVWGAVEKNVLENPAVMEVLGTVLKAVAIAAAVMTGGALGAVAVGLFILSDMNKEYGIANEVFGQEAGKWVSLGLEVAAAVCMAVCSLGAEGLPELLGDVQQVAAYGGALLQVAGGINTILDALDQRELDHMNANLQAIMNRMAALQRLIDAVLTELSEKVEGRDRMRESGFDAAQIQGEGLEAAVYLRG